MKHLGLEECRIGNRKQEDNFKDDKQERIM
jgi:hypothetical protein